MEPVLMELTTTPTPALAVKPRPVDVSFDGFWTVIVVTLAFVVLDFTVIVSTKKVVTSGFRCGLFFKWLEAADKKSCG